MRGKIYNKNIGLALGIVGSLVGALMLTGLVKGNSVIAEDSYNWDSKPVVVNIQVDLEKEGDQVTAYNILNEIEKYSGHATVFVSGEFASLHPDVVRNIEDREHQIAVHGWQKGEDLTLLNYEEQLALIQKSFSAVRSVASRPEEVVDFKPQGYKFNDDTIRILQEIGAKSISGIFSCQESFCKCWHAQQIGKITFPYPITNEFWAIPISEVKINSKDTPLDDEYINNPQSFLDYLIEKYNQQTETKDPLIFVVHPSITGANTAKLKTFSQFLEYVEQNGGKIKPLSSLRHHTTYITNFDATGPSSASTGEEITITVNYTSNIYCPHYRFRAYGKYPGQDWKLLDSYCEFVYTGNHSFNLKATIPNPPTNENIYTIRVVGRASYGSCDLSDPNWPTYDSYQAGAMKEIETEVKKPLCIPLIENGSHYEKINIVFVPDDDYGGNITEFKQHINNLINNQYGNTVPISNNMDKFNFYYTEEEGDANNLSLPTNFWKDESCSFADAVAILHKTNFGDGAIGKVFSAEGIGTRAFIHESGHTVFDLADEYTETRLPPNCTHYGPASPNPNIWPTKDNCESDATKEGWDKSRCNYFCPATNPCCGTGWWRIDRTQNECTTLNDCDEVMIDNDNGFGVACQRRINYVFGQLLKMIDILYPCDWCPKYAEKLAENSVSLYLNINNDQLTLLQSEFSESSPPNYYPGGYPFRAEIISLTGELLGEYGFRDPRIILAEIGYEGPTWIDNVDFPLTLPYFHNAKTVNIYNSADEPLFSVDISQYDSGIIEGKVADYNGQPVSNVFIQVSGIEEYSTFTDENGNYMLVGLQPGDYTVSVTPDSYANLMSAWASVSISAGEIITQNFVLNPAGSIGGKVTDIDGNPVPNVNLYLSGYEMPQYATDEEGDYIIPGLQAGTHTINIDAPKYGDWYIFVNGVYTKYGKSVTVNVNLGQTTWVGFRQQPPPSPDIWVSPESFEVTLPQGGITDRTLIIGNEGVEALEFEIEDYLFGMVIDDLAEGGIFDVKKISLTFTPPNINFNVETYTSLEGVEGGGYFWLDTDQNPSTGITEGWWPGAGLNDIGADYVLYFYFYEGWSGAGLYRLTDGYWQWIGSYPLSLDEKHLMISIPLSDLEDDGIMDVTFMGEGWWYPEWRKDIVPNVGHGTTVKVDEIDWLSLNPKYGTVEPGNQINVTLTIDATKLEPGEYKRFITITSNDIDEKVIYIPVYLTVTIVRIPAFVDFDPDVLNLKSKGQWVTVYLELPIGYNVSEIDLESIVLNERVPIELKPTEIGDYDNNGVPDLIVKFNRSAIQNILEAGEKVEITISGKLVDGRPFEGFDVIRVVER